MRIENSLVQRLFYLPFIFHNVWLSYNFAYLFEFSLVVYSLSKLLGYTNWFLVYQSYMEMVNQVYITVLPERGKIVNFSGVFWWILVNDDSYNKVLFIFCCSKIGKKKGRQSYVNKWLPSLFLAILLQRKMKSTLVLRAN